jgi:hypothetical protein
MPEETKTIVTERVGMTTDHQLSKVILVAMTPIKIVFIRATRVYLQSLVGLLGAFSIPDVASAVGVTLKFNDFWHMLIASSSLAAVPALMSALTNTLELFKKWDSKYPELRA